LRGPERLARLDLGCAWNHGWTMPRSCPDWAFHPAAWGVADGGFGCGADRHGEVIYRAG